MPYKDKQKNKEFQAAYREANRENLRAYFRAYGKKHQAEKRAKIKAKDPDYFNRKMREAYARTPKKFIKRSGTFRSPAKELMHRVKEHYGCLNPKCQSVGKLPVCCLEFHHLDPSTKEKNFNRFTKKDLVPLCEEIRKCTVLCANCHKIAHWVKGEGAIDWSELKVCSVSNKGVIRRT